MVIESDDEQPIGWVLAALRILLGLLWLQNVGWKTPPDFTGVERFVTEGIEHPTLPPWSWLLEQVIEPAIVPFGWFTLISELVLAVGLVFGLGTRANAALGAVLGLSIGLTVARAPNEWGWSYWLLIGAHLAVMAAPQAGRIASLDQSLRRLVDGRTRLGALYLRWAS
ncbi:MAG: TQO small subunit DoxD [Acidimicrobiales bacterium]